MANKEINQTVDQVKIDQLKDDIEILKEKIKELRSNNNSFIYSALTKVQAEMPIIQKNTTTFGKQKYADLAEIIRISRPILVKHGLSITQTFNVLETGHIKLITTLCHSSGQSIKSEIRLILASQDPKNMQNMLHETGKSITYLRRYTYCAIVGIATDDDTDGN